MLVATDFDAAPDLIANDLSEGHMSSWIFDQPGLPEPKRACRLPAEGARRMNKRCMTEFFYDHRPALDATAPRRPSSQPTCRHRYRMRD